MQQQLLQQQHHMLLMGCEQQHYQQQQSHVDGCWGGLDASAISHAPALAPPAHAAPPEAAAAVALHPHDAWAVQHAMQVAAAQQQQQQYAAQLSQHHQQQLAIAGSLHGIMKQTTAVRQQK